jgi:hypothetical protein
MTPRELEEYRALRATIAQRGTARVCVFAGGLIGWGAVAVATAAWSPIPLSTVVPLAMLGAVFEAVYALHIGVERIGRYLQVFHEDPAEKARWEAVAMRFGPPAAGTSVDPLFTLWFSIATVANFVPVVLAGPTPVELSTLGALHLGVLARYTIAHRAAARQRKADLATFQRLKSEV